MEAVAFGGRDVTNSAVNDWNNIQFGTRVDTTNKVTISIKNNSFYSKYLNIIYKILSSCQW